MSNSSAPACGYRADFQQAAAAAHQRCSQLNANTSSHLSALLPGTSLNDIPGQLQVDLMIA